MDKLLRDHMLTVSRIFASETGLPITTVSAKAARDTGFIGRIERDEGSFTARKYDDVMGWFSDNWPAGVEWPSDVPRLVRASEIEAA